MKLVQAVDAQSNKISNLGTPTNASDAATKAYVDANAGGGSSVAAFTITGTLSVAAGAVRWYAPKAMTVTSVLCSVGASSTGASVIFDVNKNGTTIFGTQASRPTIAANAFSGTTTGMTVTSLIIGDYITVDVDQVGSTFAGADAVVQIVYS